jgi:nicotinamide-nucleotide amidase
VIPCAILTIGSEVLDGRVTDTNSQDIALFLEEFGGQVISKISCDDDIEAIVAALRFVTPNARLVIVSGGLGPTSDDLTREALSSYLGDPLVRLPEVLEELARRYTARGREFLEINKKQADIPSSTLILPNCAGTAPGFVSHRPELSIFCLPGVPSELRVMLQESVAPHLLQLGIQKASQYTFRVFGLPESVVAARVSQLLDNHPLKLSYRSHFPEVQVKITQLTPGADLDDSLLSKIRTVIGPEYVFSQGVSAPSLEQVIGNLLKEQQLTLCVAESCTGGLISKTLTDEPGASSYFLGGFITYNNELKEKLLGVRKETLEKFGAVSAEVAIEMACGAQSYSHSSLAMSVTGIAGPDGGSPGKPVGTFFVGLSTAYESMSYEFSFASSRGRIRRFSTYKTLDLLRRRLLGLTVPE